jgi:tetratricopeptide (TPR) repeat protein
LAWLELLKGNVKGYKSYVQQVKTKGYTYHEKDKQALSEANDPIPDLSLLKARLFFDGGYYEKAFENIADKKMDGFKTLRDKIEYCYRQGRIYDETAKDEFALKFYKFAIDLGKNERYYFASNAALRIASIYENKNEITKARQYYNTALNMKDHDYESSIENKAKDGLKRIGNRVEK